MILTLPDHDERRRIINKMHRTKDKDLCRRLNAILLLADGHSVSAVSRLTAAARSSINRWVNWYPISGIIQLDDVYWGGERRGGKRGRAAAGKTPFVAAVALNKEGHPIKMRMTVVDGFKTKSVADWAKRHIASGSAVISDGLACFKAVKEANCEHLGVVTGGNLDWLDHPAFNWVNTMIGNVKNSLRGSCHTLGAKHLPRHLAEYCFRFNHRFDLKSMLVELGHAVVASPPMPYRLLKLAEGHG
ncbi:IS1595 family transposase [Aeromonas hydrophila]|uniref:IS1595 family transposase n=1 Tax=Aeromonas hydrophila TaxID=644 RepID=UPI003F82F4BE